MALGAFLVGLSITVSALITAFTDLVQLRDMLMGAFFLTLLLTILGVDWWLFYRRIPARLAMPGVSWFPGIIAGFRGGPIAQGVLVLVFCVLGTGVGLVFDELLGRQAPTQTLARKKRQHKAYRVNGRVIGSLMVAVWPLLGLLIVCRAFLDDTFVPGLFVAILCSAFGVATGLWLIHLSRRM